MTSPATLKVAQDAKVAPWDLKVDKLSDMLVAVYQDRFPVTNGHLLFVPLVNNGSNIEHCFKRAFYHGQKLVEDGECDAFNVGLNMGAAAGQTVMYPHVHLIPRRHGDCDNPIGGVRGVIRGQADYKTGGYQLPK
jgi:diadenosine tetraphosphate (Ap4A) HIT family hydrolase